MIHIHRGRTYRVSRPWTGTVDGVLADNTVWFVRRQPWHNHATGRGGNCLDASWRTRNYKRDIETSALQARLYAGVCVCVHTLWVLMAIKVSRRICRLLVLSCTKPLWVDLEELPLGERWWHMFSQTLVSSSNSTTPNILLTLRPTNRLDTSVWSSASHFGLQWTPFNTLVTI